MRTRYEYTALEYNEHTGMRTMNGLQMNGFWDECLALPSKIKDWDGYVNLNASIHKLLLLLPILHRLHAKARLLMLTSTVLYAGAELGQRE